VTLPAVPESFDWTTEAWGAALRCRPLEAIASHAFTTRQLSLTSADGYRLLAAALAVDRVASLEQVHGHDVIVIRDGEPFVERPKADAMVSNASDTAVVVRAADCVPLLMADRRTGAVAAVHAGWRGTAAGVAVAAVEALMREFGAAPGDLIVAIGPCIGPCHYEVGPELVDAFAAAGHPRHLVDRWFPAPPPRRGERELPKLRLDVAGANRDQLILAGVNEADIHMSGLCTAEHLDVLTSYRAEKEQAVRLGAAIAVSPHFVRRARR
jgi:YfiH family protein